jgi:ATP/ADP translocase
MEGKAEVIRWAAIPILVTGSMFSYFARNYEFLIDMAVCLCVIILIQRAVRQNQFFWAAGLTAIVVVFSPLFLTIKVFLLMGLTCVAACAILIGTIRRRYVEVL